MRDIDILTEQLWLHPDALDLRMQWRDCYEETFSVSSETAKVECALIWTIALERWWEESASVLVHGEGPVHDRFRWHVRRAASFPMGVGTGMCVCPGWHPIVVPYQNILWRGSVAGIAWLVEKKVVVLHRIQDEPARRSVLIGARVLLTLAETIGMKWVYPTPAELDEYRKEYQRNWGAADSSHQQEQAGGAADHS